MGTCGPGASHQSCNQRCLPSWPPLQGELITPFHRGLSRGSDVNMEPAWNRVHLGYGHTKPPRDTEISRQTHGSHPSRQQTSRGQPAPPAARWQGLCPRAPHAPRQLCHPGSMHSLRAPFHSHIHHPIPSTSPRNTPDQTVSKDSGQISLDLQLATKSSAQVLGPKGCGRGQNACLLQQ